MFRKLLGVVLALAAVGASAEKVDLRLLGSQGDHVFMSVPSTHAKDKAFIERAARGVCLGKSHCFVLFWDSGRGGATRLPMTDAQARSQLAQYDFNRYTKLDRFLWDCKRFKGTPQEQCFAQ